MDFPLKSFLGPFNTSQMKAYSTQPLMRIISRPLRACSVVSCTVLFQTRVVVGVGEDDSSIVVMHRDGLVEVVSSNESIEWSCYSDQTRVYRNIFPCGRDIYDTVTRVCYEGRETYGVHNGGAENKQVKDNPYPASLSKTEWGEEEYQTSDEACQVEIRKTCQVEDSKAIAHRSLGRDNRRPLTQ